MRWGRRAGAALCATAACAVAVGACSSSPSAKKSQAVTPGATVPFELAHNARSAVRTTGCAPSGGAWVLTGTVKNATAKATGFQIVVDFVTQPGGTVLATRVVNVAPVSVGATARWTASGAQGHTAGVGCIVRQAQTT